MAGSVAPGLTGPMSGEDGDRGECAIRVTWEYLKRALIIRTGFL